MQLGIIDSDQEIVATGLRMNLDPAQLRSYSGSGTTWFDVSGLGNNMELINGPTFSGSLNGGIINLDGVNDYATASVSMAPGGSNNYTLILWAYINALPAGDAHLVKLGMPFEFDAMYITSDRRFRWYIGEFNASNGTGTNVFATGSWYQFAMSQNRDVNPRQVNLYINTTKYSFTHTQGIAGTPNTAVAQIAQTRTFFVNQYPNMRISQCQIYNRALNDAEIAQNYNAIKSRFEL